MNTNRPRALDAVFLAALLACAGAVYAVGIDESELYVNNDETRHAMTGVFFADAMKDMPVGGPVEYAREYYERYPAIALVHWPPLFYLVEGAGFLVGGVSVVTAKAVVITFLLVFIFYCYRLFALCFSRAVALGATAAAMLAPQVVYYGRAVMLEVPVLALCTAASYYFYRALNEKKKWPAFACGLFLAGALLTKQHAFYLLPFFPVYAVAAGRMRQLFSRRWIAPAVIVLASAGGYYVAALAMHGGTLVKDALGGGSAAGDWMWYLRTLPKQLGSRANPFSWNAVAVAVAAAAAFAAYLAWCAIVRAKELLGGFRCSGTVRARLFFVCQAACCFMFFSAMSQKDSRHIIFWVPPLAVLLVEGLRVVGVAVGRVMKSARGGCAVSAVTVCLLLVNCVYGIATTPREYVRGYENAARRLLDEQHDGGVFFCGYLNGNFIFFVRKHDPSRIVSVSRASRDIFHTDIMAKYGIEMKVASTGEVVEMLCGKDVRRIVVEDVELFDSEAEAKGAALLKNVLTDPVYSGRVEWMFDAAVESNVEKYRGVKIRVYRFNPNPAATGD